MSAGYCDEPTPADLEPKAPSDWRQLRAVVLHRDNYTCQQCGAEATAADHMWPKSKGGADKLSNLQALCAPCNLSKGDAIRLVHITSDRLADAIQHEIRNLDQAMARVVRWTKLKRDVDAETLIPVDAMGALDSMAAESDPELVRKTGASLFAEKAS